MVVDGSFAYAFEEMIRKFVPLPLIQFETNLVNHCNLNCKSCDHMSPIAKEWYADPEQFAADLRRMSQLFHGEARYIRLVGGEPLLHPQVVSFFETARRFFPKTVIEIWTNGLLLGSMSDAFWEACRQFAISVCVTKYPISLDYDLMKEKAQRNGIKLHFFGDGITVDAFNNNSFDLSGRCEPRKSFFHCPNANRHITLVQGGRLYTCDKAPHIKNFNEFFRENLPQSPRDYVDIYSDVTAEDVFRFLTKPIPFCCYCDIQRRMQDQPWAPSTGSLNEWAIAPENE